GPYRLEEWIPSDRVVLVRNEDYWGELPPTERIIFRQIPEESGRAAAVLAGEAHVAERILPHDAQFIASAGGVRVIESPSVRSIDIGLNSYQKEGAPPNPFADRRVRQAVNYAIDKEAIVEFILNGIGRPVDAPITPGIFGYTPVRRYEYDPDRARRLLAEAGYPNGFQTRLYSPVGRYLIDIQITEAIQAQLSEVGVDAQIVTMEWPASLQATGRD